MTAMCSQPDVQVARMDSSAAAGGALPLFREPSIVDALMNALPYSQRRWCGMPRCECSGCANSVVSRAEWMAWFVRQQNAVCERCHEAARVVGRDGQTYLVCETCDVFWA